MTLDSTPTFRILVLVKWLDLQPEFDPLTGDMNNDPNRGGISDADQTAVEVALRLADDQRATGHIASVGVVVSGPKSADETVTQLHACGADSVIRAPIPAELSSSNMAQLLLACGHDLLGPKIDVVLTGASSVDRGSGAVPAFIAAESNLAQALGVIAFEQLLTTPTNADRQGGGLTITVLRRLDGGRRERLNVELPAVISVEGGVHWHGETVGLRRAPLAALLAAQRQDVAVWSTTEPGLAALMSQRHVEQQYLPWRPRALELTAPAGAHAFDRIVELTGANVEHGSVQTITGDTPHAAQAIVEQLREWGYLEPSSGLPTE